MFDKAATILHSSNDSLTAVLWFRVQIHSDRFSTQHLYSAGLRVLKALPFLLEALGKNLLSSSFSLSAKFSPLKLQNYLWSLFSYDLSAKALFSSLAMWLFNISRKLTPGVKPVSVLGFS